jgi:hypothetical protein
MTVDDACWSEALQAARERFFHRLHDVTLEDPIHANPAAASSE